MMHTEVHTHFHEQLDQVLLLKYAVSSVINTQKKWSYHLSVDGSDKDMHTFKYKL